VSIPAHLVKRPGHPANNSSAQRAAQTSCQAGDAYDDQLEPLLHDCDYEDDLEAVADAPRKAAAVAAAAAAAAAVAAVAAKVQQDAEQGRGRAASSAAPAPAGDIVQQQSDAELQVDTTAAGAVSDQSRAAWIGSSSSSSNSSNAAAGNDQQQ
jgi:hypothetical protein